MDAPERLTSIARGDAATDGHVMEYTFTARAAETISNVADGRSLPVPFDSPDMNLGEELLKDVRSGKIRLPDF